MGVKVYVFTVLIFRLIAFNHGSVNKDKPPDEASGKCFDPHNERLVSFGNYCAYGIIYSKRGCSDVLFEAVNLSGIEKEDFKNATSLKSLTYFHCHKLDLTPVTFAEILVPMSKGSEKHEDDGRSLFFACCTNCSRFHLPKKKLRLKLMNLCIAQQPINRVRMREIHVEGDKTFYRNSYYLKAPIIEYGGLSRPFASCYSRIYRMISSMLNNFVCISVGALENPSETFGSSKSYTEHFVYQKEAKVQVHFGQNNASALQKLGLRCTRSPVSKSMASIHSRCRTFVDGKETHVGCCCYGLNATDCQNDARRMVSQRRDVDGAALKYRACVKKGVNFIVNDNFPLYIANPEEVTARAKYEEDIENFTNRYLGGSRENGTKKWQVRKYCEMNFVVQERNLTIEGAEGESDCEQNFISDYRSEEILRSRCFVSLPGRKFCPCSDPRSSQPFFANNLRLFCCCNHRPFCNLMLDVFARLFYQVPQRCLLGNDYQHHFNKLVLGRGSSKNHSCLIHFLRSEFYNRTQEDDRGDVLKRFNLDVLSVLPGSNIFPIDFGYQYIKQNNCTYIESNVNYRYAETQNCSNNTWLDTEYLPLRLFVCECTTKQSYYKSEALQNERTSLCDNVFHDGAMEKVKEYATKMSELDELNRCANFTATSIGELLAALPNETVSNRVSKICFTSVTIKYEDDIEKRDDIQITAGVATRDMVNKFRIHLDHIGYSVLSLSGSPSRHCASVGQETACFCRLYNTSVCNGRIETVRRALTQAIRRMSISTDMTVYRENTKLFPQKGAITQTKKVEGYCNQGAFIYVFAEGGETILASSYCVFSSLNNFSEDYSFRYRKWYRKEVLEEDSCVVVDNELVCFEEPNQNDTALSDHVHALLEGKETVKIGSGAIMNLSYKFLLISLASFPVYFLLRSNSFTFVFEE